ncbi:MAG TPA: methionyl-tRNA formyltransferase [Candidatus Limnocylindrales bacterium]|nr:methionyl-tRNA formyltransferase [Candidatus Limnocylindrales bacterium]
MASRPGPPDDGRVRTVFLGSGAFAVPALRALAGSSLVRIVAVVTAPPRQVGRRQVWTATPVDAAARELGIEPVLTPPRLRQPEAIAAILALRPSLAVLADYGQIVPPPLLDLPHGALNLHPSPLPRFRGAAPVPAAILAGDAETAVTLMRMDAGLDTGPIVAQERTALEGTETAPELEARLASLGAELLVRSLPGWLDGSRRAVPQPDDGVVMTRPLRREDGRLDPARSAAALVRMVRAYQPWPGTFLEVGGERVVVNEATAAPPGDGDVPGAIVREGSDPALATPDGRLVLRTVTPAGRRPMPGADWLRGRRDLA